MMGTGVDAVSAAYTEIMVDYYFFSRTVITVFYGARRNTGMTVHAFFLINPDDCR
jgi:hypothetical protein